MRNFKACTYAPVKTAAQLLTPVAIADGADPACSRAAPYTCRCWTNALQRRASAVAVVGRANRVCWQETASTVISRAIVYFSVISSASEAVSSQPARLNRAFRNEQSIGELPCEDQR